MREAKIHADVAAGPHFEQRAQPAGSRAKAHDRLLWLDVAKGGGIVLVVIGHAMGGLIDSPLGDRLGGFRLVFLAIYMLHMPLFFFLSGLLVRQRVERPLKTQLTSLIISLAWPYFLWSAVQYTVIYAAGSLVNSPVKQFWLPLLRLPISTISQFWFLYILFFLHIAAALIVPRLGARGLLGLAMLGRLCVALIPMPTVPRLFLLHGIFYVLGVWLGRDGMERLKDWSLRYPQWIAALVIAALCVEAATIWMMIDMKGPDFFSFKSAVIAAFAWHLPALPATLLGIAAVLAASMHARGWFGDVLAYLGRRSMAIFVMHVLFIAGSRILLAKFGHVHEPAVLLVAAMFMGLTGPLAVEALAHRLGLGRALGLRG